MDAQVTPEIDATELDRRRRAGDPIAIVDVREPWELELCRLPESEAIPLDALPAHLSELPRDRPLVLVCHHGVRSQRATAWLRAHGFDNAVNLIGGVDAWAREIDPAMRTY